MDLDVLQHDDIQALYQRLVQVEEERDLLKCLNVEYAQRLQSIADGRSVAFFWGEIIERHKKLLPDTYSILLTREPDKHEWSLVHHDEINAQLVRSEGHIVALSKPLTTFSKSPSCPIRKEFNIHESPEWSLWQPFLLANRFIDVAMFNINVSNSSAYLMVVLQRNIAQLKDERVDLALKDSAHLIQVAASREYSDRMLLEEGHNDPKTGLLRSYSFENNFAMVLKDSRRHFLRVALVSLKPKVKVESSDDKSLKELASVIQRTIRDNDLVAYYGEGEFVMGIRIRHMEDAEVVATKLLKAIRFPGSEFNRLIAGGITVGVAYYPEHSSLDDLHRAAAYAASSVSMPFGYRIEFHGSVYATSSEFYTF